VVDNTTEQTGTMEATGEPLAVTLTSRLRGKRLLIILDNCEHVLGPVARFAHRLVASTPGVRLLATSREGLGVPGERTLPVPPLTEATEGVELFVERARSSGAAVEAAEQLEAIGGPASASTGLPLAIELAAARARLLAPVQISQRLDQRFRLLTGGGRTAVERHRTVASTALHLCQALFGVGDIDSANKAARLALDTAENCPPPISAATLTVISAFYALSGDRVHATLTLSKGLRFATQHGMTRIVLQAAFVAAALAAERGNYETTATLLEAARRHADPLGVMGQRTYYRCRVKAETAVATYTGDLTAARASADVMAVNDLTTYALESLEERTETPERVGPITTEQ
jgi:hypothetical protein